MMQKYGNGMMCQIALVAVLCACCGCSALEEDLAGVNHDNPIQFGIIMPVSVERTGEGTAFFATTLAAEEINDAGGVLGRALEIVFLDDGGTASKGLEAVRRLHDQGIDIIMGSAWSSVTLPVARQFTIANNMLLISHSATSPQITNLDDNNLVWRTAPSDAFQGVIGADFVYNTFGARTVGIIHLDDVYARGLSETFGNSFESFAGSGSVVSYVTYPNGQNWTTYDFTPHLDVLFAERPDAIYFTSFVNDAIKLTNDIFKGGYLTDDYAPLFFSNDGAFGEDFLANGHPSVLENMLGTQPTGAIGDPNYALFIGNFNNRFGFDPLPFNEHVYDAVYVLAYAATKAGSLSPLSIAAELRAISGGDPQIQGTVINVDEYAKGLAVLQAGGDINYNGASGVIDFDANGDPGSGTYQIWKIVNGKIQTEAIVTFP